VQEKGNAAKGDGVNGDLLVLISEECVFIVPTL
jgi:hypothetical protein